jgi:prolyl-tRNA synthetase
LFDKAAKLLKNSIVENPEDAAAEIKNRKIVFVPWCTSEACEEDFKNITGAKSLNAPFKQPSLDGKKCFACEKEAKKWFYFGKSY